jgi:hypothetical protein
LIKKLNVPSTTPEFQEFLSPVCGLERRGSALKTDPYHAFSDIIDNYAGCGEKFQIPKYGLGNTVIGENTLYQVEGSLSGKVGVFEWIIDDVYVTHRRFIPGGKISGVANQPIP